MDAEERRNRREERRKKESKKEDGEIGNTPIVGKETVNDNRMAELLMRNEDELLNFVAKVNKVYQEKLKRPAPFMTFVICGMQSAGKSTIMERFMDAVLNIIQEGTGTRCPLDTTCIHDELAVEPKCELSGEELETGKGGDKLTINQVFKSITEHNK